MCLLPPFFEHGETIYHPDYVHTTLDVHPGGNPQFHLFLEKTFLQVPKHEICYNFKRTLLTLAAGKVIVSACTENTF